MVSRIRYRLNKFMHHGAYMSPVNLCIKKELKNVKMGEAGSKTRENWNNTFKKAVRKCYAIQRKKRLEKKRK